MKLRNYSPRPYGAVIPVHKRHRLRLKWEVLEYYSKGDALCACCGEDCIAFLTLDHVNNNGAKHRRELGYDKSSPRKLDLIKWVKANNYPEGFQVLCFNCNAGKYINGGVCPHIKPHPTKDDVVLRRTRANNYGANYTRQLRIDEGLCTYCGDRPPRCHRRTCQECADIQSKTRRALSISRKKAGLCRRCGKRKATKGAGNCAPCTKMLDVYRHDLKRREG